MYLTRLLSLSSTGTILIASQIPWFFKSSINPPISLTVDEVLEERKDVDVEEPQKQIKVEQVAQQTAQTLPPEQTPKALPQTSQPSTVQSSPTPARKRPSYIDINKYEPDGFITRDDKKRIKGNYERKELKNKTISLQLSADSEDYVYISSGLFNGNRTQQRDFSLYFRGYESQYDEITVDQISISLFTNPAWKTKDQKEDEYATKLTTDQVNELFTLGMPDRKLKQLLLSLTSKRLWKRSSSDYKKKPYFSAYNLGWTRPSKIEELKNLKISYFTKYEELKEYIQKKVDVCTGEKNACIADIKELDTFDYDEKEFHEGTK